MSKFGLFTQILMILIAVIIVVWYIKPTLAAIRTTEDSIALYQREVDNVSAVNQDLSTKIAFIDAVPAPDTIALLRYLPDSVDEISVMKDILAILSQAGVTVPDVTASKAAATTLASVDGVDKAMVVLPHEFQVTFKTAYKNLITVLSALESNNYLLQVSALKVSLGTTGELNVAMTLTTYSLAPTVAVVPEVLTE